EGCERARRQLHARGRALRLVPLLRRDQHKAAGPEPESRAARTGLGHVCRNRDLARNLAGPAHKLGVSPRRSSESGDAPTPLAFTLDAGTQIQGGLMWWGIGIGAGILYIILVFTLGLMTLRNGHG